MRNRSKFIPKFVSKIKLKGDLKERPLEIDYLETHKIPLFIPFYDNYLC